MKFDMSYVMRKAWSIKKNFESKNNKKALFSECLKEAWRIVKTSLVNKEVVVKDWFLKKNFTENDLYMIGISFKSIIVKETLKAALVKFTNEFGSKTFWIPKSCLLMAA